MAFNPGNAEGNEVTGTATGGVEMFAAAEGKNLHVFNNHSGALMNIFYGDSASRIGDKAGHTGVITCISYDMFHIYSGGADEVIIKWSTTNFTKELVFSGHEGSISAVAVGM
jgi:hypothetical protein